MREELERSAPEREGMDGERLNAAFRLLEREAETGEIPGGVALVGRYGRIVASFYTGLSVATDFAIQPVQEDTIYDCASLTKVVVTLPLILQLIDGGEIRLGDPVCRFIPTFAAEGKTEVTVRQLLSHNSGLAAYTDLYSHGWALEQIKESVWSEKLQHEPGAGYVYSDLNFIALGEIASILFGKSLETAAYENVFKPLGMTESGYRPDTGLKPRIAATEFLFGSYRWGDVHDKNTYAMGGVSGHAGMFSTAADLAKYAAMWLDGGRYPGGRLLSEAVVRAATRNCSSLPKTNRGLGWVLKGDAWDASGDLFSPASYGHTGFTGTSLFMDPTTEVFVVLLTNRVHFGREKSVARLRDCFHNAVAAAVLD
ncbi:serine hydrolase domain-containing protein [Paenibacillus koleovorans]|uniref:serine hydrolase domain-containing protein n=1 Tax=Paenibacillus koleovorans TaxID=121608 RepID=UPI001FE505D1|nr:serine hydrolase domain-containing protein [Paenibacillus koleovorans]